MKQTIFLYSHFTHEKTFSMCNVQPLNTYFFNFDNTFIELKFRWGYLCIQMCNSVIFSIHSYLLFVRESFPFYDSRKIHEDIHGSHSRGMLSVVLSANYLSLQCYHRAPQFNLTFYILSQSLFCALRPPLSKVRTAWQQVL